jgi:hypothetical protein
VSEANQQTFIADASGIPRLARSFQQHGEKQCGKNQSYRLNPAPTGLSQRFALNQVRILIECEKLLECKRLIPGNGKLRHTQPTA